MRETDIEVLKTALRSGDVHYRHQDTFLRVFRIGFHQDEDCDCAFLIDGKYAVLENADLDDFFFVVPVSKRSGVLRG